MIHDRKHCHLPIYFHFTPLSIYVCSSAKKCVFAGILMQHYHILESLLTCCTQYSANLHYRRDVLHKVMQHLACDHTWNYTSFLSRTTWR